MIYEVKDNRFLAKLEVLVEKVLAGGIRRCRNVDWLVRDEFVKLTKELYYLYKRLLICHYESLESFRKVRGAGRIAENAKTFLSFLQMEILRCDDDYKMLLHIIDEVMYKKIYFDEDAEQQELLTNGIFPINIVLSKTAENPYSYENFMNNRTFAGVNDINRQCKAIAINISKSLAKFKENMPGKRAKKDLYNELD